MVLQLLQLMLLLQLRPLPEHCKGGRGLALYLYLFRSVGLGIKSISQTHALVVFHQGHSKKNNNTLLMEAKFILKSFPFGSSFSVQVHVLSFENDPTVEASIPLESVVDRDDPAPDVSGLQVWHAACALASTLRSSKELEHLYCGRRVLELGAGPGLVGLALADRASEVWLTDGDAAVCRLLQLNVAVATAKTYTAAGTDMAAMHVRQLRWEAPCADIPVADLVIGAEVSVTESAARAVVSAAAAVSHVGTHLLLAHIVRRAAAAGGCEEHDTAFVALRLAAATHGWRLEREWSPQDGADAARAAGGETLVFLLFSRNST
jgi:predicted nicotinamide N-methyase